MTSLPQEIIDYIINFVQFDHQTLKNIREASPLFLQSTDFIHNVVEEYTSIFNQPLSDENNNLLVDDMLDHLKYLDSNNIPIEKAKKIDTFIKEHDNDIDYYIPSYFGNGKATLLLNYHCDYNMVKYLLYLGANPNCTTTRDNYHIANMINIHCNDIDQKALMFALLINYGMDINLSDYDVGESLSSYLLQNQVLRQKVFQILDV